jgi:hypothetical protein
MKREDRHSVDGELADELCDAFICQYTGLISLERGLGIAWCRSGPFIPVSESFSQRLCGLTGAAQTCNNQGQLMVSRNLPSHETDFINDEVTCLRT